MLHYSIPNFSQNLFIMLNFILFMLLLLSYCLNFILFTVPSIIINYQLTVYCNAVAPTVFRVQGTRIT